MRTMLLTGLLGLALILASAAEAGSRGPHPIRGWKGNEFLFEVQPQGDVIHLVGYRAIGNRWQQVGATQIRRGQRGPAGGWLQEIWFHGRDLGALEADMSDPWWRYYPGEDRNGSWPN